MIEPSDAERANLPDATRDYLATLEARVDALEGLVETLRDYARDMKSGALRGRFGQSYESIGAEDLARADALLAQSAPASEGGE